ncbi:unnamed protein product [Rotaria sp. Silwood1]|nr:unnamed protein product [Rotaria sp. Silwood1]CAF3838752.1 unnamed protein product [Rotaria sp. Silwood1]CAF3906333.1 unnamed protein product [Rotaria sp. Silwood1]CAF4973837.1 unnamed protein product [Rotaria sp. Silwood1]
MSIKIVSGGQTGVDRSALDVAIELNYKYGGWCPRGRKAEDGIIDSIKYANLEETSSNHYPQRTEFNVRDSDGTLIIIVGNEDTMGRGSKLTVNMTKKYEKPLLIINLNQDDKIKNETKVIEWLSMHKIKILNIAGPREETTPGIYKQAEQFLRNTFTETFDECPTKRNIDENYPSSPSPSPMTSITHSNPRAINSTLINSQRHLTNHSTLSPCTVSKRSQKLNKNDNLLSRNSLVQTTTRNNKISNGNDDDSSSTYKQ